MELVIYAFHAIVKTGLLRLLGNMLASFSVAGYTTLPLNSQLYKLNTQLF